MAQFGDMAVTLGPISRPLTYTISLTIREHFVIDADRVLHFPDGRFFVTGDQWIKNLHRVNTVNGAVGNGDVM